MPRPAQAAPSAAARASWMRTPRPHWYSKAVSPKEAVKAAMSSGVLPPPARKLSERPAVPNRGASFRSMGLAPFLVIAAEEGRFQPALDAHPPGFVVGGAGQHAQAADAVQPGGQPVGEELVAHHGHLPPG